MTATDAMSSVPSSTGICGDDGARVMGGLQRTLDREGQHRAAETKEGKGGDDAGEALVDPDVGVNGTAHERREELLGDPLVGAAVEVEVRNGHLAQPYAWHKPCWVAELLAELNLGQLVDRVED